MYQWRGLFNVPMFRPCGILYTTCIAITLFASNLHVGRWDSEFIFTICCLAQCRLKVPDLNYLLMNGILNCDVGYCKKKKMKDIMEEILLRSIILSKTVESCKSPSSARSRRIEILVFVYYFQHLRGSSMSGFQLKFDTTGRFQLKF